MAARPPFQLVAPTDGTPGAGSPAGSTTTNGMPRAFRRAICSGVSSETTRIRPAERRLATASTQERPERARALLRGEHDAEVVLARDLLDALDDLHRPRALELVEDDVEQGGVRARGGGRR